MGIEGVTGAVASFQNSNSQISLKPQVQQVSPVTQGVSGADQNAVAQEVLTVKGSDLNGDGTGSGAATPDGENKQPSKETVKQAISDINKKLNNTECVWGVDDDTNRITIKIVDKETKDIIKELPPEKTLEMIAKAWELAGIMVDEKL